MNELDPTTAELVQGAIEKLSAPMHGPDMEAAKTDGERRRQVEKIIDQHQPRGRPVRPLSASEIYSGQIPADAYAPRQPNYPRTRWHDEPLVDRDTNRRSIMPELEAHARRLAYTRALVRHVHGRGPMPPLPSRTVHRRSGHVVGTW